MTITLTAVILALAAGWCLGHRTGRTLRRAAILDERAARPTDGRPLNAREHAVWEQLTNREDQP
ncbi:hypothetical protein [Streptomyces sp. NPDC052015]|uniref:hypothetical protein n=1 Tax=Streptomyces sp. NPDC052015 TaxID=3154755 RepID=UPI00341A8149